MQQVLTSEPAIKEILSTITSKGQITIPVEVRRHLKVATREKVAFVLETDGTVRLTAPRYPDIASLRGAAGTLKQPLSWQQVQKIAQEDRLQAKYPDPP